MLQMKSNEKQENQKKKDSKTIIKFMLVLLAIYLLISAYKFVKLYNIYKIADSFSENNYWMTEEFQAPEGQKLRRDITKVGNKKIEEIYDDILEKKGLDIPI